MRISFLSLLLCGVAHMGSGQALADDPSWDSTHSTLTFNPDKNTSTTYANGIANSSTAPNSNGQSSVVKIGDGTAILTSQNNYYNGPTSINAGTLQLGDGKTTGSISNSSINIGKDATLAFNAANTDNVMMSNPITGDKAGSIVQNGNGSITFTQTGGYNGGFTINSGTVQLGDGSTAGNFGQYAGITNNGTLILAPSGSGTLSAPISGSGSVRLVGKDITSLANTGAQASITNPQPSPAPTTTLTGDNSGLTGETQIAYGTLALGAGGVLNNSVIHTGYKGVFDISDATPDSDGTVKVKGLQAYSSLQSEDGSRASEMGGSVNVGDKTLEITDNGNTKYAGSIQGGSGGLTLDSGNLVVAGGGTYTGTTTIRNKATLELDGTNKSSQTDVSGSTLQANGTISGSLNATGGSVVGPARSSNFAGVLGVGSGSDPNSIKFGVSADSTTDLRAQYSWATTLQPAITVGSSSENTTKLGAANPVDLGQFYKDYKNKPNLYSGRGTQGYIVVNGTLNLYGTIVATNLTSDLGSGIQNLYSYYQKGAIGSDDSPLKLILGSDDTQHDLSDQTAVKETKDYQNASSSTNAAQLEKAAKDDLAQNNGRLDLVLAQSDAKGKQDQLAFWNGTNTNNSSGVFGGSGNWSSGTGWVDKDGNNAQNVSSNPFVIFSQKGGNVTVSNPETVTGMQFAASDGSYTLGNAASGSNPGTITLDGTDYDNSAFGVSKVDQDGMVTNSSGKVSIIRVGDGTGRGLNAVATINSVLQDTNSAAGKDDTDNRTTLVKTDLGTLVLGNTANTYTGGTVVTNGTLQIAGEGSLGQKGTTVSLDGGALAMGSDGIHLTDDHPILLSTNGGASGAAASGGQLNLNGQNNTSVDTAIKGAGSLIIASYDPSTGRVLASTKSDGSAGSPTLNLNQDSTYTGATAIEGLGHSGSLSSDGSKTPQIGSQLVVNANTLHPFGDAASQGGIYLNADAVVNMIGAGDKSDSVASLDSHHNVQVYSSTLNFLNQSTAANAQISTNSAISGASYQQNDSQGALVAFHNQSTAGNASITNDKAGNNNGSVVLFDGQSKASQATITNQGASEKKGNLVWFTGNSTAESSNITNTGASDKQYNEVLFDKSSNAGSSNITNTGSNSDQKNLLVFTGNSTAYDPSSSAHATITNISSNVQFNGNSHAGRVSDPNNLDTVNTVDNNNNNSGSDGAYIHNSTSSIMSFNDNSRAGNANIVNGPPNSGGFDLGNNLYFTGNSHADTAQIVNGFTNNLYFQNNSSADHSVTTNEAGTITFQNHATAQDATIVTAAATLFSGTIDLSGMQQALHIGSASGLFNIHLGGNTLYLGNLNKDDLLREKTSIDGDGSLVKEGTGTLTLQTQNQYKGDTWNSGGTLDLQHSILGNLNNGLVTGGSLNNNVVTNVWAPTDGLSSSVAKNVYQDAGTLHLRDTSIVAGALVANGGSFDVAADNGSGNGSASVGALMGNGANGAINGTLHLTGCQNLTDCQNLTGSQNGTYYTYGGVLSDYKDASGNTHKGSLTLDKLTSGTATQILTNQNTYTGQTTIGKGRTLALARDGRIDDTSSIANDGTLVVANDADQTKAGTGDDFNTDRYSLQKQITGAGSLEQDSNGITEVTGGSNYAGSTTVNSGVVQIDDGATVGASGVTNMVSNNGTLRGAGTLAGSTSITGNGLLQTGDGSANTPRTSSQNLTIDGDLKLGANTTTLVHGFTRTAAGQSPITHDGKNYSLLDSDRVMVNGTAALGGTLAMNLSGTGTLIPGQAYRVLEAKNGVVKNSEDQKSNFSGLKGVYAYLEPKVVIDSAGEGNPAEYVDILLTDLAGGFSTRGKTPNEITAGHGLDHVSKSSPLAQAALTLPADQARQVLNNLSGEIHASVRSGLIQDSFLIRNAVLNRLANDDCTYGRHGQSTYDMKTHRKNDDVCSSEHMVLWGQAYGSMGHNSGDGNASGMGHNTAGFILGADTPIRGTNWHAGGLVGYGHSGFNSGGRASSASSNNLTVGGYAGTHWGPVHLRLGGTYSWNMINTRRQIAVGSYGGRVNSHYLGGTAQAFAELGYRMHAGRSVIEPFMNVAYVNMQTNGFRERGNDAALLGHGRDTGVTFSSFGVRAGAQFRAGRVLLMPHIMAAYRHGFGSMLSHQRAGFAAAGSSNDMNVSGVLLSDNAAVIDTGLTARITDRMDVDLSYVGQYGNHSVDSGATGSVRMYF